MFNIVHEETFGIPVFAPLMTQERSMKKYFKGLKQSLFNPEN